MAAAGTATISAIIATAVPPTLTAERRSEDLRQAAVPVTLMCASKGKRGLFLGAAMTATNIRA